MARNSRIEDLADQYEHLAGQLCLLYRSDVVRFLGIGIAPDDSYYIVQKMGRGEKPFWASIVGHIDSLKSQLSDEIYTDMERLFAINGSTPADLVLFIEDEEGYQRSYERQT